MEKTIKLFPGPEIIHAYKFAELIFFLSSWFTSICHQGTHVIFKDTFLWDEVSPLSHLIKTASLFKFREPEHISCTNGIPPSKHWLWSGLLRLLKDFYRMAVNCIIFYQMVVAVFCMLCSSHTEKSRCARQSTYLCAGLEFTLGTFDFWMIRERVHKKATFFLLLFLFCYYFWIYYEAQKTDGKLSNLYFFPKKIQNCPYNKGMKCFSMTTACFRLNPLH